MDRVANPTSRAGFTLLELILVLAIISVFVAISAPSIVGFRQRARLDHAADGLLAMITEARTRSIRDASPHRVVLDEQSRRAWIERLEAIGYEPITAQGETWIHWDDDVVIRMEELVDETSAAEWTNGEALPVIVCDVNGLTSAGTVSFHQGNRGVVLRCAAATEFYRRLSDQEADALGIPRDLGVQP